MRNGQGPKHSIFTASVALLPLSPPFHGGEAAPDHHQRRHRSSLPPSRSRRAAGMPRATSSRMPECIQCLMEGSRRPRPHPPSVRVAACLVGRNLVDGRGGGLGCGEGGGAQDKEAKYRRGRHACSQHSQWAMSGRESQDTGKPASSSGGSSGGRADASKILTPRGRRAGRAANGK